MYVTLHLYTHTHLQTRDTYDDNILYLIKSQVKSTLRMVISVYFTFNRIEKNYFITCTMYIFFVLDVWCYHSCSICRIKFWELAVLNKKRVFYSTFCVNLSVNILRVLLVSILGVSRWKRCEKVVKSTTVSKVLSKERNVQGDHWMKFR